MKLELVHLIDASGEWYKVEKDGNRKFFAVDNDGGNRESKLKEATDWYNRVKKEEKSEVILSEEI